MCSHSVNANTCNNVMCPGRWWEAWWARVVCARMGGAGVAGTDVFKCFTAPKCCEIMQAAKVFHVSHDFLLEFVVCQLCWMFSESCRVGQVVTWSLRQLYCSRHVLPQTTTEIIQSIESITNWRRFLLFGIWAWSAQSVAETKQTDADIWRRFSPDDKFLLASQLISLIYGALWNYRQARIETVREYLMTMFGRKPLTSPQDADRTYLVSS